MQRFVNAAIFATVAGLVLWARPATSRAGLVTVLAVDVNAEVGGLYEYDYALSVPQDSTLGASQLFLAVSTGADLNNVSAPIGWDVFYTPGDPDISFLSSGPSADIAPGTFGLFSLTSLVGPAANDYLIRGFDYNAGTFDENVGTVLTASAVPEPSGLVLGALGVAFVAACSRGRTSPG
jgi:hypothetical protein